MTNKEQIQKFRDTAELAWAAYGYYDLIGKKFKDKKDKNENPLPITLQDIMDITYENYEAVESIQLGKEPTEIKVGTLKGDFSPTQAKNFFEKYELLIHQPNTSNGFSATLFL